MRIFRWARHAHHHKHTRQSLRARYVGLLLLLGRVALRRTLQLLHRQLQCVVVCFTSVLAETYTGKGAASSLLLLEHPTFHAFLVLDACINLVAQAFFCRRCHLL